MISPTESSQPSMTAMEAMEANYVHGAGMNFLNEKLLAMIITIGCTK